MADAPISGLPVLTSIADNDLILIEHNGAAYKVSGANWKQYFNANVVDAVVVPIEPTYDPYCVFNATTHVLTFYLPSSDEVVSCTKTSTSGLVDTWTCTTALGETFTFTVTNGGGSPASEIPLADVAGGAVGTSEKFAREDHRHPIVYPDADNVQALALNGHQYLVNPVDDLSNYATGFALFNNVTARPVANFPYSSSETQWALVISTKADAGTVCQVAVSLLGNIPPRIRYCANGTWSAWTNLTTQTDSGWIEVTFTSDFKNYGTTNKCQYRKVGNVVTVCGAATPVNDITGSNTQYTMFTLPAGFRPKVVHSSIQQGSGNCRWQMQIGSGNGAVTFSRYANENGLQTAAGGSPGAWLVFSATFLTA